MKVTVGYSENPDSLEAGRIAALEAIRESGRDDVCDLVLMFATARHDAAELRTAVAGVVGAEVPVYGGGAVGGITNDRFGYAGDQIVLACIWLDGVRCDVLVEDGLLEDETEAGRRLGVRLGELGVFGENGGTTAVLFYDAIDVTGEGLRLIMATRLLAGIEKGLGILPDVVGAGLQGDHVCSPAAEWLGDAIGSHQAIALVFSGDVRIDSVIMHGCRPATRYYTVTKADGQVILEINGQPALRFIEELLGGAILAADFPFHLILGVNKGDKWGEYDEDNYASRLCLAIDEVRGGIVMFEPDMVEGTEFQIMYPTLEPGYMRPRIEAAFERLGDREPVFALYIDCAGRAAGYGGIDLEDAVVLQETVAGRAPILGIYTGVEIASVRGRPRGLDWTGVFCLFSVPQEGRC